MGAVFRGPKTGNPYSEAGFKAMWNRLMGKALAAKIVCGRALHLPRPARALHHALQAEVRYPARHARRPGHHRQVYDRSRDVRRQSL